jgi:cytidyltransferase-like protein
MTRVYAKVAADLFHFGHVRFFRAARSLGDHLTVCVVPDERVTEYKKRPPLFTLDERLEIVSSCRWVDETITSCPKVLSLQFMTENNFDLYAFGAKDEAELEARLRDCEELPDSMKVQLPYTNGVSSTSLKQKLSGN